ncbi:alpha-tocopherol transfer protein-like [Schistocerca piceifrons]|uniref:alpha-tocopherol transfer protein-like n=1 Tax=Schistocerca piceifrons TaxID=274613 RepID=UPI001F5F76C9|nr:alpha-tocopherol transfer protein-like [Schistocerca piceifrons]XP_049942696.1 alpha-tocopherol transfer protein-like [Schistocerca serialis cubense]
MGYREVSPELEAIAVKELNEDPKRRDQDIQHIKDWLSKQPHLRARDDDQWILTFLRGCKFSLEKTKQKLDMFYTLRSALPDIFINRDPFSPKAQKYLSSGVVVELPRRSPEGRRVIIWRPRLLAPGSLSAEDVSRVNFMNADATLHEDDATVICGEVTIQDFQGTTMAHFASWTPWQMKRITTCFQDGYPLRAKGLHMINVPSGFEKLFSLFEQFFKEKIRKRIFVHANLESLHKHVPKEILPEEYGGDAGPIDKIQSEWRSRIERNAAFFKEDDKYGVDESKRPGKPKTQTDLFGVEGSFRQLAVD